MNLLYLVYRIGKRLTLGAFSMYNIRIISEDCNNQLNVIYHCCSKDKISSTSC